MWGPIQGLESRGCYSQGCPCLSFPCQVMALWTAQGAGLVPLPCAGRQATILYQPGVGHEGFQGGVQQRGRHTLRQVLFTSGAKGLGLPSSHGTMSTRGEGGGSCWGGIRNQRQKWKLEPRCPDVSPCRRASKRTQESLHPTPLPATGLAPFPHWPLLPMPGIEPSCPDSQHPSAAGTQKSGPEFSLLCLLLSKLSPIL